MYMSILFLNWFIGRGLQSSRTESMQLNGYPFNCVNSEKKKNGGVEIYIVMNFIDGKVIFVFVCCSYRES